MKLTDSLIPYNLMSMHPLLHLTMLTTGLILVNRDKDGFYEIEGNCSPTSEDAKKFLGSYKENLMNYALLSHAVSIALHYAY